MFNAISWVSWGFRWLNFGIFIGLGWYLYRRFWTPGLQQQLQHELHQLYQQERTLGQLNEALQAEQLQITEQQAQYAQLLQKIKQWQRFNEQQQAQLVQAQQLQQASLAEKRQLQTVNLALTQLQQQLWPQLLTQSTTELQRFFMQPVAAQRYQQAVLQQLSSKGPAD